MLLKLIITLFLVSNTYCNEHSVCHNNNDLECRKTYDLTMFQELNVCKDSSLDIEAFLECKIVKFKHGNMNYDAFNLKLNVSNKSYVQEAVFEWTKLNSSNESSTRNQSLNFTLNNETSKYEAILTIYNIEENVEYDIKAMFDNYTLSCSLKHEVEEEATSLYMSLLVMGVMVIIYIIVVVVFWLCPPEKYKTIDELLANLPSKHVEALKELVSDDINLAREFHELEINNNYGSHSKKNVNFNMTGMENRAYEDDVFGRSTNNDEDDDNGSINRKLYQEANKLRKMSRVSQHSSFNSDQKSRVRFANIGSVGSEAEISIGSLNNINLDQIGVNTTDLENLQIKIMREKRRRDSVHPFKKTYALTTIESSDSD